MEHKEYKRIIPNSDVAILFIHGIIGTPNHFSRFVSLLPPTISVHNLLLDGHGKSAKDFAKTSMQKWEEQVSAALETLSYGHKKIFVVAHSMGTLFAIEQAVKNQKISGLFLLAVPLRLSIKFKMIRNTLKVHFDRIHPNDYEALAAQRCYGITKDRNLFHYIGWIPRYLELFAKIRHTRKILEQLKTECLAYQSINDEIVSKRSIECLKSNPHIAVNELSASGHYFYDESDWEFLLHEFEKMLKR